ncbi:GGDEF domain-containing protein [Candidatus Woesebacteria bacterium]|nr:GGDEF domain-containing protein [Candidatus Woesebacteria bacterium]
MDRLPKGVSSLELRRKKFGGSEASRPALLRSVDDLSKKLDVANENALVDVVTGLHNRRFFNGVLTDRLNQMSREKFRNPGAGLALVTIDLDNFKPINDKFGNPTGDMALRAVANAISKNLREGDVEARTGGDEYSILMTTTNIEELKKRFFGDTETPHTGSVPKSILYNINQSIYEEIELIKRDKPEFKWEPAYFDDGDGNLVPTYLSAGMSFLGTNLVRGVGHNGLEHGMNYLIEESDSQEKIAKILRKTGR